MDPNQRFCDECSHQYCASCGKELVEPRTEYQSYLTVIGILLSAVGIFEIGIFIGAPMLFDESSYRVIRFLYVGMGTAMLMLTYMANLEVKENRQRKGYE